MDEFSRHHGYQRLLFFSDAVFAIAITLLVLDLRLPPGSQAFDLADVRQQIVGFVVSFYVIGRFWLSHHALFEGVAGYDTRLLWTNLLFLAAVVFLPFPTTVVSELDPTTASVTFYALSLTAVGVLMMWLTWIARRPALLIPGETRGGTIRRLINIGASTTVFALTALAAQIWPRYAMLALLLLFPVGPSADALGRRLMKRVDARAEQAEPRSAR
jgi:uncharacterized membrane protein